jgi:hypothetical protein
MKKAVVTVSCNSKRIDCYSVETSSQVWHQERNTGFSLQKVEEMNG